MTMHVGVSHAALARIERARVLSCATLHAIQSFFGLQICDRFLQAEHR
jgi:hypothetical protein